jgi:ubiquitin-conjugating enzyme E2 variant
MDYLECLVIIIGAWFFADLITGIFHWAQDQYLLAENTNVSFLKQIAADNDLHHTKPAEVGKHTLWENTNTSIVVSIPVFIICWLTSAHIMIWLGVFFGIFANAIHSFTHKPKTRIPLYVSFMQTTGMFQQTQHHAIHHYNKGKIIAKEDTTIRYCVMTNYLNPILDTIKFFPFLEWAISLFGIKSHRLKKLDREKTA